LWDERLRKKKASEELQTGRGKNPPRELFEIGEIEIKTTVGGEKSRGRRKQLSSAGCIRGNVMKRVETKTAEKHKKMVKKPGTGERESHGGIHASRSANF